MKKKENNTKITLKKRKRNNTQIIFFQKIGNALNKFRQRFGCNAFGDNFAGKCFEYCSSIFTEPVEYNVFANKCVVYINLVGNYFDELWWHKSLKTQFKLKGFVYYRGGCLLSGIENIHEKYRKTNRFRCKFTKEIYKHYDLYNYVKKYNLLMNENLMGLESGLIKQFSLRDKLEEEFMGENINRLIDVEDDILKTATQLV